MKQNQGITNFWEIPRRQRKPDPSMAGDSHTDPQLPVVTNLGSAAAPDLQRGRVEDAGEDVIHNDCTFKDVVFELSLPTVLHSTYSTC
jgi:hypothetical protein